MYMEEESFASFERTLNGGIPLTTLKPIAHDLHQDVLIIYGGSIEPEFRKTVKKDWGEELVHRGVTVHCFDFLSNMPGKDLKKFSLWTRVVDTSIVADFLLAQPNRNPLTILGSSMGGYIAAYLASTWEHKIAKLVLVAPAAYHDQAVWPTTKFGVGTKNYPGLHVVLNDETKPYTESGIFRKMEDVTTDTMVVAYEGDDVVKEIPMLYLKHLIKGKKYRPVFLSLPGGHEATDPERTKALLSRIVSFIVS